jgi:hypothetical protein
LGQRRPVCCQRTSEDDASGNPTAHFDVLDYASRKFVKLADEPAHFDAQLEVRQIHLRPGHFIGVELYFNKHQRRRAEYRLGILHRESLNGTIDALAQPDKCLSRNGELGEAKTSGCNGSRAADNL